MDGITYIEDVISNPLELYLKLEKSVNWDDQMQARKTASYGVAYNYSQMSYAFQEFLPELEELLDIIEKNLGFRPNNCLINFYLHGKAKMGWHSDQTDILHEGTGVAIISLGDTRSLRFREIEDKENKIDFPLPAGSLIYMTQKTQDLWQHSVPKLAESKARMSLTFRSIK
ncbi:MAG: alkylated DNA repair dioxygenase AlkB [Crocinitomix sp.]|jgi:alkylated DNA repair dioxygenase AlkB